MATCRYCQVYDLISVAGYCLAPGSLDLKSILLPLPLPLLVYVAVRGYHCWRLSLPGCCGSVFCGMLRLHHNCPSPQPPEDTPL